MAIPFLNKMDAEGATYRPIVTKAGVWQRVGADTPDIIAHAVAAHTDRAENPAVSIPSIWAHAWFFHRAWSDSKHESHIYASELWRRFVFLVALREILPASRRVTLRPIKLNSFNSDPRLLPPSAAQAVGETVRTFTDAASVQYPQAIFAPPMGQEIMLYAVHLSGQAIGLLVPGMMALPGRALLEPQACPAAVADLYAINSAATQSADHHWFYTSYLTAHYRRHLASFLVKADGKARGFTPINPTLQTALLHFLTELNAAMPRGGPLPVWADGRDPPNIRSAEAIGLFRLCPSETRARLAFLQVNPPCVECGAHFVPISATDRSLAYLEMDTGTGELVRDFVDVPARRAALVETHRARAPTLSGSRILLLTEDDLFETYLIHLPAIPAAPASGSLFAREYLLPVTPLALALLGAEGLQRSLCIEPCEDAAEAEDLVTVSLTLQLACDDPLTGGYATVSMRRAYRKSNSTLVDASLSDAFAVWPDFILEKTAGNAMPTLAYQATNQQVANENPPIRAECLLARADLADKLQKMLATGAELRWPLTLRPTEADPGHAQPILQPGRDRHDLLYTGTCAEGVQVGCGPAAHGLFLRHWSPWRTTEDRGLTGIIAIDFGTSSTTVAFQVGDQQAETTLHPHVWCPFRATGAGDAAKGRQDDSEYLSASRFFLPPVESLPTPFPTVLQIRRNPKDDDPTPLMRARIPFVDNNDLKTLADMIRRPPPSTRMVFKLKWAENEDRRILVQQLLNSIMLLAFAHARSLQLQTENIEWRLTIPKVMSTEQQARYRTDAYNALRTMFGAKTNPAKLRFFWESAAVHAFVRSRSLSLQKPLMATIDIGGQSTDICISSGGRILADGSADFAGRMMLVNLWADCWTQYEALVKEVTEAAVRGKPAAREAEAGAPTPLAATATPAPEADQEPTRTGEADPARVALVELQLSMPDFDLATFVANAARVEANPLLKSTALRIRFSYLAVMYFLIHHGLKPALSSRGIPQETRNLLRTSPGLGVFLGGRGSKLFRLFCWDSASQTPLFQDVVEGWLEAIGLRDATFAAAFAERNAKQEVALGCLALAASEAIDGADGFAPTAAPEGSAWDAPPRRTRPAMAEAAESQQGFDPQDVAADVAELVWTQIGTFEKFCADINSRQILGDLSADLFMTRRIKGARQAAGAAMPQPERYVGFRGFDGIGQQEPSQCPRRRFMLQLNAFLSLWDKPGEVM